MTTPDFNRMAVDILFAGTLSLPAHGVVYREGKGRACIEKAIQKAMNPRWGMASTPVQISVLERLLKGILKPVAAQARRVVA